MRRSRLSSNSWPSKRKIITVILVAVIILVLLVVVKSLFRVSTIVLQGVPAKETVYGISSLKGRSTLFIDTDTVARSVTASNPRFRVVSVQTRYPSEIVIRVEKTPGVAYMVTDRGYYLLSEDARVIERSKSARGGIPTITWYQPIGYDTFQPGDKLDFIELAFALHLLESIAPLDVRIDTVDINGRDMIGLKSAGRDILISTQKDADTQVYQMGVIIKQFRVEGKNFKSLDLRFDKPTLVISN